MPVTQEVVGSNPIGDAFHGNGVVRKPVKRRSSNLRDCLWVRLPPALLFQRTNSQVAEQVDARPSDSRAHSGVRVRLSPWLLFQNNIAGATGVQLTFMRSVCSARYRDLQLECNQRRGWASAQPGLISLTLPGATPGSATFIRPGTQTGKAVTLRAWRFCGFDPHLGHWQKNDRVVQRRRRLRDMQENDGSIPSAITGVSLKSDSVSQLTLLTSHFIHGLACPRRRLILARSVRRVRFPCGPLNHGRAIR